MKRNESTYPEFDDIVFENRNKNYGAYRLRKYYKTVASLSAFGGSALFTLLVLIFAFSSTDEVTAKKGDDIIIIIQPDNSIITEKVKTVEPEKKIPQTNPVSYKAPVIVDDTSGTDNPMLSYNEILDRAVNPDVYEIDTMTAIKAPVIPEEPETFYSVEEMPVFPGGQIALLEYIAGSTKYPEEAALNNIQGKVIVKFAVEPDGSIDRVTVIRAVHPLLDEEAARVIKTLPGWTPGKQNGKPVPVWFVLPVNFQLREIN